MELEGILGKWAPYFIEHAHLIARTKPIAGKLSGTRIVEAFEAGDAAAARRAIRDHIETGREIALDAIERAGGVL